MNHPPSDWEGEGKGRDARVVDELEKAFEICYGDLAEFDGEGVGEAFGVRTWVFEDDGVSLEEEAVDSEWLVLPLHGVNGSTIPSLNGVGGWGSGWEVRDERG